MVSLLALYYGVVFENGDKLALNGVFMGNACVFLAAFRLLKTRSFLKFSTYFVKNFYSLSKP
ncbi:hypothetical protein [Helicobacter pylori]|uniref:hypothetical protein n=1 Tax=Helicobacter pylori TaxID=210 RepID=UPI001F095B3B|nr:hypothetical protein [Helicobacter pylori]